MKNDFNLCPMCGSKNIQNKNDRKWFCPDCGFDLYCNVAASVGVLIFDENKNFLFEKRAKEPKKGFLTQPGGFIDADESAEQAVERECLEELGVRVKEICYLGTYPNTYEYKNITYKTCDMFFTAKIADEAKNASLTDFALTNGLSALTGEPSALTPAGRETAVVAGKTSATTENISAARENSATGKTAADTGTATTTENSTTENASSARETAAVAEKTAPSATPPREQKSPSSLENFFSSLKLQKTEVEKVVIEKISSPDDIERLPLAFISTKNALKDFFKKRG